MGSIWVGSMDLEKLLLHTSTLFGYDYRPNTNFKGKRPKKDELTDICKIILALHSHGRLCKSNR